MKKDPLPAICSRCNLRELCLPTGLTSREMEQLDAIVNTRRKLVRGEALFHSGDAFKGLYAVRTGFLKSSVATETGKEQVVGFQMAGDIIGLDGIGNQHHLCDVIALETTEVCIMPWERLEAMSKDLPVLQRHLHRVMSQEIVREHGVMLLLGTMRAEERLAAFLLNLAQRLNARGFSASEFILRMTRDEIGSYLGLKLETVSRTFTKLVDTGVIAVKSRHVQILDMTALKTIANAL